jgi:hypothetical protein
MQWKLSSRVKVWEPGCRFDDSAPSMPLIPVEPAEKFREYDAFNEAPGLFFRLATTDETSRHAIQTFAGQYGSLFGAVNVVPLRGWQQAILLLRWATDLWRIVSTKNEEDAERAVVLVGSKKSLASAEKAVSARVIMPFATGDAGAGEQSLGEWLDRLDLVNPLPAIEPTAVKLLALPSEFASFGSSARVAMCRLALNAAINHFVQSPNVTMRFSTLSRGGAGVEVQTTDLYETLWVQLALVVFGEHDLRFCQQCGRPFTLVRENRSDRVYCSNSCKTLHIYHRRQLAKRLHAEGRSLLEIVREVKAPETSQADAIEIVRRWIGTKKPANKRG